MTRFRGRYLLLPPQGRLRDPLHYIHVDYRDKDGLTAAASFGTCNGQAGIPTPRTYVEPYAVPGVRLSEPVGTFRLPLLSSQPKSLLSGGSVCKA